MIATLQGKYRFEIHREDGSIHCPFNGAWVPNMVLNSGLDMMFSRSNPADEVGSKGFLAPMTYCRLSETETGTVSASDQFLSLQQVYSNSYVRSSSTGTVAINSVSYGSDANYCWADFQRTFVFAPSGVSRNWNGVGVSIDPGSLSPLFSKVILSPNVTVLGTEEFRVIYKLRVKLPLAAVATSLSGGTFSGAGSLLAVGAYLDLFGSIASNGTSLYADTNSIPHILRGNGTPSAYLLSNSAFPNTGVAITPAYSGSGKADSTAGTVTAATYTSGTFYRDYSATWATGRPVATVSNVRSIFLGNTSDPSAGLQWLLSANQTKDTGKALTATFRIAWGRTPEVMYSDDFNSTTLDSKWTWYNTGGATTSISGGKLTYTAGSFPTGDRKYLTETLPNSDWTFEVKMRCVSQEAGIAITNADGSRAVVTLQNGSTQYVSRHTNFSFSSNQANWTDASTLGPSNSIYYKVAKSGGNVVFSTSADGVTWTSRWTESISSHLVTASRIGFYAGNSTTAQGEVDYITYK